MPKYKQTKQSQKNITDHEILDKYININKELSTNENAKKNLSHNIKKSALNQKKQNELDNQNEILAKFPNILAKFPNILEKLENIDYDFVTDEQACHYFIIFDSLERYEDMFGIIIKYPRTISDYFAETSNKYKYNIENKWDGDLKKFIDMTPKEYKDDIRGVLIMNAYTNKGKLCKILKSKLCIENKIDNDIEISEEISDENTLSDNANDSDDMNKYNAVDIKITNSPLKDVIKLLMRLDRKSKELNTTAKEIERCAIEIKYILDRFEEDFGYDTMFDVFVKTCEKLGHTLGPLDQLIVQKLMDNGFQLPDTKMFDSNKNQTQNNHNEFQTPDGLKWNNMTNLSNEETNKAYAEIKCKKFIEHTIQTYFINDGDKKELMTNYIKTYLPSPDKQILVLQRATEKETIECGGLLKYYVQSIDEYANDDDVLSQFDFYKKVKVNINNLLFVMVLYPHDNMKGHIRCFVNVKYETK